MIVRQKLSVVWGAAFVGFFLIFMGIAIFSNIDGVEWIAIIFFLLGAGFSLPGIHLALNRKHHWIEISKDGISKHFRNSATRLGAEEIKLIEPYAHFLKGRGIRIHLTNGSTLYFDCRHYCSIRKFISGCREAGLPCA